jgi:outer membrane biosynthesis protein TonB
MKKLLLSLVALLALTSVSFAVSTEAQEKKNQLLPIVNLILNSNEYSDSQKSLVKSVIKNCATSNKNETIKGACSLIVEELEQQPENVAKPTESQKPIVIDEECDFLVVEQSDFNRKII